MIKQISKLIPKSMKRKISHEIKEIILNETPKNSSLSHQVKSTVNIVQCCICGQKSTMFLPFNYRHFVVCPNCGSFERHRMVWHYLINNKILQPKINLLHFAPELIFYKKFKTMNINYFPVDFEPKRYGADCKKMDATDIKHQDNFFDMILSNHLLEHIPDDLKAMREFHRVLKPTGFAVVTVPMKKDLKITYEDFTITEPKDRQKAFGQSDHVRRYGMDFKDRLKQVGFEVEEICYSEILNNHECFKQGFSNEIIFICRKKIKGE